MTFLTMKYLLALFVVLGSITLGVMGPDGTFACYPSLNHELKPTWVWCPVEEPAPSSNSTLNGDIPNEEENHQEENQQVLFA